MKFKDHIFPILITSLLTIMAYIFMRANDQLERMAESMTRLNEKIGVVITKGEYRDTRINDHEVRLRELEKK